MVKWDKIMERKMKRARENEYENGRESEVLR